MGSIVLMLIIKCLIFKVFLVLVVSILGVVLVVILYLEELGLKLVGDVSWGLLEFQFFVFLVVNIYMVIFMVIIVIIISIVELLGIVKVLELKNKDIKVFFNQEFFVLGMVKLLGLFFQVILLLVSFMCLVINNEVGVKMGMVLIVVVVVMGLMFIFFILFFYYLLQVSLVVIVLMVVWSLFDIRGVIYLWEVYKKDFFMLFIIFVIMLVLGIEEGVLVGVILLLLVIIFQVLWLYIVVLG